MEPEQPQPDRFDFDRLIRTMEYVGDKITHELGEIANELAGLTTVLEGILREAKLR